MWLQAIPVARRAASVRVGPVALTAPVAAVARPALGMVGRIEGALLRVAAAAAAAFAVLAAASTAIIRSSSVCRHPAQRSKIVVK